jgi:hypothetical protein
VQQRLAWRGLFIRLSHVLGDAGHAGQAIDARVHQQVDLIDQAGLEENTVEASAAFQQQRSPDRRPPPASNQDA